MIGYYAEISHADHNLGRIRTALRELGIADDTLLICNSDNGTKYAHEHDGVLRGNKGTLYEGGIRVPQVVEFPRIVEGGQRTGFPTSGLDILPTLFELAGVSFPENVLDGASILPVLQGTEASQRQKPIPFWYSEKEGDGLRFALIDNQYKLHANPANDEVELYDLDDDRAESDDISGDHQDVVSDMLQKVKDFYLSVRDSWSGNEKQWTGVTQRSFYSNVKAPSGLISLASNGRWILVRSKTANSELRVIMPTERLCCLGTEFLMHPKQSL